MKANHSRIKVNLQFFSDAPGAAGNEDQLPTGQDGTTNANDLPAENGSATQEELYELTYNGATERVPRSKLIELGQKGMNYDKIHGRLKSLEEDPRLRFVEELASDEGLPVDRYIEAQRTKREQERIEREAARRGVPVDVLPQIERGERAEAEAKEKDGQAQRYLAFVEAYPDIDPATIPAEVYAEAKKLGSLVDAYTRHENKVLKARITKAEQKAAEEKAAAESNARNAATSAGGAGGASADREFFTKEEVKAMSQAEVKANLDKINRSMQKW